MKYLTGDLLKLADQFDVLVHGCNCFKIMGGGIAKQIRDKFPEAYQADLLTSYGNEDKLGTISFTSTTPIIVNAYTQFKIGNGLQVNYNAVRDCMKEIKKKFSGKKIGMPKIGSGLAGGDWSLLERIIEQELEGEEVTVVLYG